MRVSGIKREYDVFGIAEKVKRFKDSQWGTAKAEFFSNQGAPFSRSGIRSNVATKRNTMQL